MFPFHMLVHSLPAMPSEVLLCELSFQKESVQSRKIGGGCCIGINAQPAASPGRRKVTHNVECVPLR